MSSPEILAATLGALLLAGLGYKYSKQQKTQSFITNGGKNKTRRR